MTESAEHLLSFGPRKRSHTESAFRHALWFTACCALAVGLAPQAQSQPANLNLSNTSITSGTTTYQATSTITAGPAFTIGGSASVTFQASNTITLTPGFQAAAGTAATTFLASIVSFGSLTITTTSPLPGGTAGSGYATNFSASGGTAPYSWSLASGTLPAGLSLSSSGLITGTPTTPGTSSFTIRVTGSGGQTATSAFSLTISGPPPQPSIFGPPALPYGIQGQPYGPITLTGSGGTGNYNWSATGLPSGVSISPTTGVISGTPATGSSNFYSPVITLTDASTGLNTTRTWNNVVILSVSPLSLNIGASSIATAITVGAPPGVVWSAVSTNTTWLTISSGGSGNGSGTIALNVAANTGSTFRTAYVTLSIAGGLAGSFTVQQVGSPLTITTAPLPTALVGSSYSQPMSVTGGAGPYTWSGSGLPAGLSISTSGVISGTPSVTANAVQANVSVTDSANNATSGTVALTVAVAACNNQPIFAQCTP